MRTEGESHSWPEVSQVPVPKGPGKARITREEQARRSVRINRALRSRREGGVIQKSAPSIFVGVGKRGLPAQTGVNGQAAVHLEAVLDIKPDNALPQVIRRGIALVEAVHLPDQEVCQVTAREGAVKRKGTVLVETGDQIVLGAYEVDAKSDLMAPADQVYVVGVLKAVHVEVPRRARTAADAEKVGHRYQQEVGHLLEHVDAEIVRAYLIRGRPAVIAAPRERGVERIQQRRAERIGIADCRRLDSLQVAGLRGGEQVLAVVNGGVAELSQEVPSIQRVLCGVRPIHAADDLVF